MMTELRGASNAKAKLELEWRPAHPRATGALPTEAGVDGGGRLVRFSYRPVPADQPKQEAPWPTTDRR